MVRKRCTMPHTITTLWCVVFCLNLWHSYVLLWNITLSPLVSHASYDSKVWYWRHCDAAHHPPPSSFLNSFLFVFLSLPFSLFFFLSFFTSFFTSYCLSHWLALLLLPLYHPLFSLFFPFSLYQPKKIHTFFKTLFTSHHAYFTFTFIAT